MPIRILLACFLSLPMLLHAQQAETHSNWRVKTLVVKENKPFRLDSLTVLPGSLEIYRANTGERMGKDAFAFDYDRMTWLGKTPDTLDFRYQVLLLDLETEFSRLDTHYIRIDPTAPPGYVYDPFGENQQSAGDIFNLEGMQYNGSFTRGISFGNSQDLVLNSAFNLQMQGRLGDDMEILAAISDQNIPLQPEGNTQNIQDFDRVFIQIKRRRSSLIAGDFDLRRPNGYFMNYNKKLQGAKFDLVNDVWDGEWHNSAAFAISGGKFARQNLPVTEGNQGPYKLRGNDNELFIIVLSGTEKVFLDGQLLTRGERNDYVIEYNRGEVSFTTNRLITKDSRIAVEFEYTDQSYTRFLYTLGSEYQKGKWTGRLNLYNEQDAKSSTGNEQLTEAQIAFLTSAGDDFQNAFAPGIDTLAEFTTDRITYAQVDTLLPDGRFYANIIIYNTNPDSAKYTARFTEVGQGKGNYVPAANAANGRVYEWVAPNEAGELQGNFEPVVKIIAPQRRQLLTVGGQYDFNPRGHVRVEGAMSMFDLNRFSDADKADDRGASLRADYEQTFLLRRAGNPQDSTTGKADWQLATEAGYEYKQRNFQALSPYRSAEFARDWDIDNTLRLDEHLVSAGGMIRRDGWGAVGYKANRLLQDTAYAGIRHDWRLDLHRKGYGLLLNGSYLRAETAAASGRFFRPRADVSKIFGKFPGGLKIGAKWEREKKQRRDSASDSLLANSFFFDIAGAYFETTQSGRIDLSGDYRRRWDYAVDDNAFASSTIADEANIQGRWNASKASKLRWNMTYRNLRIQDAELTTQEPLATYLGRVEHALKILQGLVYSNTQYELGSGQEPELEFVYQEVNAGEGVYTWIDRNRDSIPQLDEFEVAVFQDQANYVRLSTLTDRYVRANQIQFGHTLHLEPKALLYTEKGNFKAVLAKLSLQSNVRVNRKVRTGGNVSAWNPFQFSVPDSSLVTRSETYRLTLFFNRADPKYDLRIGLNHSNGRNILTTGFEQRSNREHFFATRWNISEPWRFNTQFSEGRLEADSEFFNNKDYRIRFYEAEPTLAYQPSQRFRLAPAYRFRSARNQLGRESAVFHEAKLEMTYNKASKTSIRSGFAFVTVNYRGEVNTPVSYTMLEGKQDGNNYLWSLNFDKQLSRNMLLSLSYEGRKTGEAEVVHVGRASIRANF